MNPHSDIILPIDIQAALDANEKARSRFEALSPSHRTEYLNHINEAKKPETRARRIENMIARLSN